MKPMKLTTGTLSRWQLDIDYHAAPLLTAQGEMPFHLHIKAEWRAMRTGIFGPSGSGKSTLLEILLGLRDHQKLRQKLQGSAQLDGRTLFNSQQDIWLPHHQRQLGWVPQSSSLFPHLSVAENIAFAAPTSANDSQHLIDALGLQSLLMKRTYQLSGGEQQRVALARALAANHLSAVLLDEPLSNLDKAARTQLVEAIRQASAISRKPLLFVSHEWDEIEALCDHVLILENGFLTSQRQLT